MGAPGPAAAAGILVQYFSGAEGFPLIPPGPIVLLVAAAVVATRAWSWTSAVEIVAPLFVLVGGTIATIVGEAPLDNPGEVVAFVGAVIQFLGAIIAVVAGILVFNETGTRPVLTSRGGDLAP